MLPYQLIFHPENYYTLKKKKRTFPIPINIQKKIDSE